jgi:2-polyprenyl-3-methyl-5-hydroxy-6-metoxy-1,4-benzoquinol methylase
MEIPMTHGMSENYFNQRAATWDSNPDRLKLTQAIMNCLSNRIPLSTEFSVLDYGCGTGLLSVLLSAKVKSVTSADTSIEMLAQLRQKLIDNSISNINPVSFDITKPERSSSGYDLVVSSMTLHHLPDAMDGIRGLSTLVKPGGWLALADLCPEDGSFHTNIIVKYNGFDPKEICTFIEDLNFQKACFEIVYEIPKDNKTYPVFCVCAQSKSR